MLGEEFFSLTVKNMGKKGRRGGREGGRKGGRKESRRKEGGREKVYTDRDIG